MNGLCFVLLYGVNAVMFPVLCSPHLPASQESTLNTLSGIITVLADQLYDREAIVSSAPISLT